MRGKASTALVPRQKPLSRGSLAAVARQRPTHAFLPTVTSSRPHSRRPASQSLGVGAGSGTGPAAACVMGAAPEPPARSKLSIFTQLVNASERSAVPGRSRPVTAGTGLAPEALVSSPAGAGRPGCRADPPRRVMHRRLPPERVEPLVGRPPGVFGDRLRRPRLLRRTGRRTRLQAAGGGGRAVERPRCAAAARPDVGRRLLRLLLASRPAEADRGEPLQQAHCAASPVARLGRLRRA